MKFNCIHKLSMSFIKRDVPSESTKEKHDNQINIVPSYRLNRLEGKFGRGGSCNVDLQILLSLKLLNK